MSKQEKQIRLEGVVRAFRYDRSGQGKQFLGATIECGDGTVWVVDYDEESPFHAFADRQVVVSGEPYEPDPRGPHLIVWRGCKTLGHLRVSIMRLSDATAATELFEVRGGNRISGRFIRVTSEPGESTLSFVSVEDVTFLVANDPAGAAVGTSVEVWAYPVQLPESTPKTPGQNLWIICPRSAEDLWEWRERHS